MTTMQSPGVQVTVTDESVYSSATQGTIPLIIIGTHEYKAQPSGSDVAVGTLPENANKLYLITSQRELMQTFGVPVFYSSGGTSVHGYELNEYGLHAAYQYLGLANTAYVIRGAIDYSQLRATTSAPRAEPLGGTYWFNPTTSIWGVFQHNGGSTFSAWGAGEDVAIISKPSEIQKVLVSSSPFDFTEQVGVTGTLTINGVAIQVASTDTLTSLVAKINLQSIPTVTALPANSETSSQSYLVLRQTNIAGNLEVSANSQALIEALRINNTQMMINPKSSLGLVDDFATIINDADHVLFQKRSLNGLQFWFQVGSKLWKDSKGGTASLVYAPHYQVPNAASYATGDVWIKTTEYNAGSKLTLKVFNANTGLWNVVSVPLYVNDVEANSKIGTLSTGLVYAKYGAVKDSLNNTIASIELRYFNGIDWEILDYESTSVAPTTEPEDGTMWYNENFRADIMICDGDQWKGYANYAANAGVDPNGPIIAGSAPTRQLDGSPLVNNDLWINSSNLEDYPRIYRFNASTLTWEIIDNKDQTSPFGIVFADARWNADGTESGSQSVSDLMTSDFVDPDAPDARVYPDGMLLFNTRYSTYNVKAWKANWMTGEFDGTDYTTQTYNIGASTFDPVEVSGRWVTISGNRPDGSPYMGRKAQRALIVKSLGATISGNEDIRAETVYFNIMAAPGYTEMLDEMVTLNTDQKDVAFIIGDTPIRLKPDGTSIAKWANPGDTAVSNGDEGITTYSPYVGVYYPWGLSTNIDGSEVMVPPSTIGLRTFAYNDSVGYVWQAPAGYTRGLVTNASTVGYLTNENEFKPVLLNQGQRDVLQNNKINPIAYMPNRGLCVFGQKTRHNLSTALDRINVARLINYLRYNLDELARPFLMENNTEHTRDSVRVVFERFLGGLVGQDALYDYIVVCDDSNNTPERIDRNELWIDIAIKPVKAIEFIYIPLRIVNTGDDLQSMYS